MNTPPPSPPGELVEDSEPEREQQRVAFKAQKREERKQKKLKLQQQQQEGGGTSSRSGGTGEGFSAAGSSRGGGAVVASSAGGEGSSSRKDGRGNEGGARAGSSPFSSLSPTTTITTKPIDFSFYAYPKAKLKGSTSSNSFTSTTTTTAAPPPPTTSSYFPPRPSTSSTSLVARRSKSKSIDPSEAPPPECTFTDVEMRRLKKCVLCGEDWSQPGKKSRTKWVSSTSPSSFPSFPLLFAHLLSCLRRSRRLTSSTVLPLPHTLPSSISSESTSTSSKQEERSLVPCSRRRCSTPSRRRKIRLVSLGMQFQTTRRRRTWFWWSMSLRWGREKGKGRLEHLALSRPSPRLPPPLASSRPPLLPTTNPATLDPLHQPPQTLTPPHLLIPAYQPTTTSPTSPTLELVLSPPRPRTEESNLDPTRQQPPSRSSFRNVRFETSR